MQKTKEKFKYLLDKNKEFNPAILRNHIFTNEELHDLEQSLNDEIFLSCFNLQIVREIHRKLYSPVFAKNEYNDEVRLKSIAIDNPFIAGKHISLMNFSIWVLYIFYLRIDKITVFRAGTQLTKAQNRALYNFICQLDKQKADEYFAEYNHDFSEPINTLMQYLEKIFIDEQTASDALYEALKPEQPIEATQSPNNGIVKDFIYFTKKENGKYTNNKEIKSRYVDFASAICYLMIKVKKYPKNAISASWFEVVFNERIFEFDIAFKSKVKNQLKKNFRIETEPHNKEIINEICTIVENYENSNH